MKKKYLVTVLVLTLFLAVSVQVNAEEEMSMSASTISEQVDEVPENMMGLDFPNYGWVMTNEAGQIEGYRGFNLALGYSQKNYFDAGLRTEEWNNYWGWGTTLLIVPYAEIGTEYVFEPNHKDEFWTAGAGVGIYNLFPIVKVTASYHF